MLVHVPRNPGLLGAPPASWLTCQHPDMGLAWSGPESPCLREALAGHWQGWRSSVGRQERQPHCRDCWEPTLGEGGPPQPVLGHRYYEFCDPEGRMSIC